MPRHPYDDDPDVPFWAGMAFLIVCAAMAVGHCAEPRVTIALSPRVVMSGGTFRLTCRVPRAPENRLLEYGVVGYREGSQRDLEGENSQVTFDALIEHTPCEAGPAYCAVRTADGRWTRVVQAFDVAGCGS